MNAVHPLMQTALAPFQPKRGTHSATITILGVSVEVTYNQSGRHYAATETTAAEYPDLDLISAHIGGEDVLRLRDMLDLDQRLYDEVQS